MAFPCHGGETIAPPPSSIHEGPARVADRPLPLLRRMEHMRGKRRLGALGLALACFAAVSWFATASQPPRPDRDSLLKTYKAGNFKDAYEGLRKLTLDPRHDPIKVCDDLNTAIQCLRQL